MRKQAKQWVVTLNSHEKTLPGGIRIEVLTMAFQRALLMDAAEMLATEARDHGADLAHWTTLCASLRQATETAAKPRGSTMYYGNRDFDQQFILACQRDLPDGTWYGLDVQSCHLDYEVVKALAKLTSSTHPSQVIAALHACHAVWVRHELVPCDVPPQWRALFGS